MSDNVLFQRGSKFEKTMWDDSEMIAAWNAQLEQRRSEHQPTMVGLQSVEEQGAGDDEDHDESQTPSGSGPIAPFTSGAPAIDSAAAGRMPPMPSGASQELQAMLQAWFQAGYWTGRYDQANNKK